jgi:glycine/D-amino acid oxidase-like deaminating enzyme
MMHSVQEDSPKKICVIGAGTVGLSVALCMAKEAANRFKQVRIGEDASYEIKGT